jgi:hypothetical protein
VVWIGDLKADMISLVWLWPGSLTITRLTDTDDASKTTRKSDQERGTCRGSHWCFGLVDGANIA